MTYHDDMAEGVDKQIQKDPEWLRVIWEVLTRLKSDFYPDWFVEVVMQTQRKKLDMYDAAFFIQVYCAYLNGAVAAAPIGPIGPPNSDKQVEENNLALTALPEPFQAQFLGGVGDNDGFLKWSQPIYLATGHNETYREDVEIGPLQAPLEVGYTRSSTTLFHLTHERGVARWPYNSHIVFLMMTIDSSIWTVDFAYERALVQLALGI